MAARNSSILYSLTSILVLSTLAGCTVGPNYKAPEFVAPKNFGAAPTTQPAQDVAWWKLFNDPILDQVINVAHDANLDLKAAEARVREARATRNSIASDRYPSIDAAGSYTRQRSSQNTAAGNLAPTYQNLFQAGFDATWEMDVFGGIRRQVEAANADVQSAIADRNDVLLSLLGETARVYVDLRGAQRQVIIAEDNVKAQQQTLDLTKARLRAGLANDLDVARQEAQVASTASQIPSLQTQVAINMHALALLTAQTPTALDGLLGQPKPVPAPPPAVPVGLPSDLLRRRPDIRRAERNLAGATARIGVATADLYPRFTLGAQLGLASNKFSNWGSASSRFWNVVPGVSIPIFNAGQLQSNIAIERARTDRFAAIYEKTVLSSLAEVEDALVAYQKEFVRREQLANAVNASQRSVTLSQQLYQQGLRDFINVLDAQRALYASQDALAASDTQVSANAVSLFKALGGGWEVEQQVAAANNAAGTTNPANATNNVTK